MSLVCRRSGASDCRRCLGSASQAEGRELEARRPLFHGTHGLPHSRRSDTCWDMAAEAPRGTVTLMFSDIEGSTRLLRRLGDGYADLLSRHRDLMREAFSAHRGFEVDEQGDAFFAVFASASDAAAAAAHVQQALAAHEWPDGHEIRVRIGLHTGEPG